MAARARARRPGLNLGGAGVAAAVIVKHTNPCGAAVDEDLATAYAQAFEGDPVSAFGGIVALSGASTALARATDRSATRSQTCWSRPASTTAPSPASPTRRKNMRVLAAPPPSQAGLSLRQIDGGFLVQEPDLFRSTHETWRVVTRLAPTAEQWRDLELAWRVCARTSSNAIVLAYGGQVVGIGCGQQNRVDAAQIAARKAAGRAQGGAGASDAFFPFRDGVDAVIDAGVAAVVQPGGSLRDDEVIVAADERGISMVLTGERHFRH